MESETPQQCIPNCEINVNMALYLHKFVEWDEDMEQYTSYPLAKNRAEKLDYIHSMFESDCSLFKGCLEEVEWLHLIEQDVKVKRVLASTITRLHHKN